MTDPDRREPLLVADAGVPYRATHVDPVAAWLELMDVVEALAPVLPPSPPLILHDARL